MKSGKILAVFLVFLIFTSTAFALDFKYPAKVERVIDGDTIVADLYLGLGVVLNDQYIRFYGIDAWETRGEERPRGLLAKAYVEERVQEGGVVIEIRPEWGREGQGKYGRWLGIVFINGECLNQELVRQGHAQLYSEQLPSEETETSEEKITSSFIVVATCFEGNPTGIDEWVVIQNVSDRTYNLKGWHIADNPDHHHEFEIIESIELLSGEALAITNTRETEVTVPYDKLFCLGYYNYWWTNKGDIVRLIDHQGKVVMKEEVER